MKQISRGRTVTAIAVAATVLALAASWLVAGATGLAPEPTPSPETLPPAAASAETPLPDFLPSEQLPAGSSVAFPTDI
jgi:hypothetical protein